MAGTLLLFVTFTQGGGGGATQFIILYLPILFLCLFCIALAAGGTEPLAADGPVRARFLFALALVLLGAIALSVLQHMIAVMGFALAVLCLPVGPFLQRLPTYAYYAAILNAALYLGEVLLAGQLGLPFDPSMFNYLGVDREGVITTWGLNRYAGHHTEPGSFAINFAGLTMLSLMGTRKPTWFHWLAVLLLAGTLSVTAMVLAVVVTVSILLSDRLSAKTVLIFVISLAGTVFLILQVLPLLGLLSLDFLTVRFVERGGTDGSLYVKQLLLEDIETRDAMATLFGNRSALCDHCIYAKSLGFGVYMIFEGGIVAALALAVLGGTATLRLGRRGLMLFVVFMMMRLEFFFPQALMLYLVIVGLPAVASGSGRAGS
ncbi:hypothetical protein [Salipiger marinus]|uniref:Uncharacterized protein n=1 Tax=Salipiger marinus TaxID=555512 RepID=A0A1G8QL57_9RHOB|nr:hypothetical protein [Salipiger marinus]SDJ05437.1 hypothetical protein SAMN04487993_101654 [Salipiger marinus]